MRMSTAGYILDVTAQAVIARMGDWHGAGPLAAKTQLLPQPVVAAELSRLQVESFVLPKIQQ